MSRTPHLPRLLVLAAAGAVLLAPAKKPYENVHREILIEPYWEDSKPASNILPGARTHDRDDKARFESRQYERFTPAEFARGLMAPDMKAVNLLRERATFTRGSEEITLDLDRLKLYAVSAKNNPDMTDVLVFQAGFLLFSQVRDEEIVDVILPVDSAIVAPLLDALKAAR
jgi:hypothetical protein